MWRLFDVPGERGGFGVLWVVKLVCNFGKSSVVDAESFGVNEKCL